MFDKCVRSVFDVLPAKFSFNLGKLKHEIPRESIGITLDRLVERARLNPVDCRQLTIENDPLSTQQHD